MQLSKTTLNILKNFATINQNLYIQNGQNVIKTICSTGVMYAEAEVEERFPVDIAIYHLPQFLKIYSMFDKPTLNFEEKFVIISDKDNAKSKYKFFFQNPDCLKYPKGKIPEFESKVQFNITEEQLSDIVSMARVSALPKLLFESDGKEGHITAIRLGDKTSNTYEIDIDMKGEEMKSAMEVGNLNFLEGDYFVEMNENISRWTYKGTDDFKLHYAVSMLVMS